MDYELFIEETEADYKILVDVYCNYSFTAGRYSGKPEDCWPDEEEFSIEYFQIREIEIIGASKNTRKKIHEHAAIQELIKAQGFDIKEVLENDENLKEEWIKYNGGENR